MEVKHIQVDKTDPESGYLELTAVVAEITKVIRKQGYSLVALRDFVGQEITALTRGRAQPSQNDVGKVSVFMLSGQTKGDKVQYSGFYNPNDDIPPQYQGKRPPQPERSRTASEATGGRKSSGNNRSFALSYVKDMVCSGVITLEQIPASVYKFNAYLDTGVWPLVEQPKQTQRPAQNRKPAPAPEEQEIPETTGTGGFDEQYNEEDQSQNAGAEFGEGSLNDVPF
jgi:hypothetical protein